MHLAFFQIVAGHGGSTMAMLDLAKGLAEHMEVTIVDVFGGDATFRADTLARGLAYRVLVPHEPPLPAVGARAQPLRRLGRLIGMAPQVWRVRDAAARLLSEIGATVILTNDFRSLALVAGTYRLRRVDKVVHLHGWWTPETCGRSCRFLARRACDALLAVSYQTRAMVVGAGVPAQRVHVVYNGIDAAAFRARAEQPLAAHLPQAERPLRLLLPAMITPVKRQDVAVRALKRLIADGHDAVLWLAGAPMDHVGEAWMQSVAGLARRLGVEGRVEWLGGRSDVPQVMAQASAVILASDSEGHPRVCLEAFALERPFLCASVGGLLDMVLPGVTGWRFEPGDDLGLANAVSDCLGSPQRAARICANARQYVEECFTPGLQVERVRNVLNALDAQRRGG